MKAKWYILVRKRLILGKKGAFLLRKQNSNPTLSVVPHRLKWMIRKAGMGNFCYGFSNLCYRFHLNSAKRNISADSH